MRKEKKKKVQNKGITLLALVITVVILLILAGASIAILAMLHEIVDNSIKAKTQTAISNVIEQARLDVASGMVDKLGETLTDDELTKILEKYGTLSPEETELKNKVLTTYEGKYKISVSAIIDSTSIKQVLASYILEPGDISILTIKDNYIDKNGDKACIPEGFKVSDKSDQENRDLTTINTGLVIIGPDESEFVWVPVRDINNMLMCKEHYKDTENAECDIKLIENDTKLICKTHGNSSEICGKLYATDTEENFDSLIKNQTFIQNSGLREPDVVLGLEGINYDANYKNILTKEQIENEFKEMALSVAKYGGFYISRYEMGLGENSNPVSKNASIEENNITTAVASKLKINNWYGLYNKAKEYLVNNKIYPKVKSSMVWGSQYDAMINWMQNNGIDVESTVFPKAETKRNLTDVTGKANIGESENKDILNNIYDLWGCNFEATLEAYNSNSRIIRRR